MRKRKLFVKKLLLSRRKNKKLIHQAKNKPLESTKKINLKNTEAKKTSTKPYFIQYSLDLENNLDIKLPSISQWQQQSLFNQARKNKRGK